MPLGKDVSVPGCFSVGENYVPDIFTVGLNNVVKNEKFS